MVKDNKGYTLIELIVVIAIMAVISGVCFLSYGAATQNEPQKTKNDIMTRYNYLRDTVKAKSPENAAVLFRSSVDDKYYFATGKFDSTSGFVPDDGSADIAALISSTDKASANTISFGKKVDIYYNSTIESSKGGGLGSAALINNSSYVLVRYSKKDGSVLSGGGTYYVSKRNASKSTVNVTITKLIPATGNFVESKTQ